MCVIKNKHKGSKLSPGFPTSSSTDCGVDQGLRRGCGETIKDRKAVRERKVEGGETPKNREAQNVARSSAYRVVVGLLLAPRLPSQCPRRTGGYRRFGRGVNSVA